MGTALKKIREKRQMSQRALAEMLGYKFQTISAYEQPGRQLPEDFLDRASRTLNVPKEELSGDSLETLKEQSTEYRVTPQLDPGILTDEQLREILDRGAREYPNATAARQEKMMGTLFAVIGEIYTRTANLEEAAKAAAQKAVSDVENPGVIYGRKKK